MSNDDNSIYFQGGRTGILLVHGLCGTPLQVRYVARGLSHAGYTVHCPQLAGHCGTFEDLRASNWVDWYASCERAFKKLSEECDEVVVAGLSGGSLLALNLAAEYPKDVLGAIAISPPLSLDGWAIPRYARLFNLIRHRWFADLWRFPERQPYGIKDVRLRNLIVQAFKSGDTSKTGHTTIPGSLMIELRWLVKALRGKLGSIEKPVLIVHPRDDDRTTLRSAAILQQELGGRVETLVLHDSYHIATMDRQKDDVMERMIRFADDLSTVQAVTVTQLRVLAAE